MRIALQKNIFVGLGEKRKIFFKKVGNCFNPFFRRSARFLSLGNGISLMLDKFSPIKCDFIRINRMQTV